MILLSFGTFWVQRKTIEKFFRDGRTVNHGFSRQWKTSASALSFRDVEEMLAMSGVALSYETNREWSLILFRLS
jgi:hypothetical protein